MDFTKTISDKFLQQNLNVESETLQEEEQNKTLINTQNKIEKGGNFDSFENEAAKTPKFSSEGQIHFEPE